MSATLYAGPGKVYLGAALWPEGENGQVTATIQQEAVDASSAMHGRMLSLQGDVTARITLTPLDQWDSLPTLFPAYLGVKVGATSAALLIGTRPHNPGGAGDVACKIWTPDARLYSFPRSAITKHPDIHLGIDKALFGAIEITGIGATGKKLGDAGFLYTITETAGADPGGQMALTNFERGAWTGIWGTAAGFGGEPVTPSDPLEAEDEWTISTEVKYSQLKAQKLTRAFKLDSVKYMVKVRPYGPTHTQIDAAIGINSGRVLGSRFGTADLVLTGPAAKTITLKNCSPVGAGFEFGGTKLGTGEIGFVNQMTFTAGVAGSLIEFSA